MTAINCCLILVLFWGHLGRHGSNAVQINIDPPKSIATTVDAIHISCVPDNVDEYLKGVNLIELSRNDQDPLVFIPTCGNVSFGEDTSRFQAVANIAKDPSQSYLNVSLMNPRSDDTGIYTCSLHYIDESGHMKMETASQNLLIENIDVKSLEKVLNQMGDEITSLGKKVTSLGKKVTSLEMENKDLKEKVIYNVGFMVTNKEHITPTSGTALILPDIIWSTGKGYDNTTGVFTAPVPGMYAFFVTVRTYNTSCEKYLFLIVNGEIFSKLYDYSTNSWPQNSITTIVKIQTGDRVYLKSIDACGVFNDRYTLFTGYLLKTF